MRILLTRPQPDASELKGRLEALGHVVDLEPLLRIEPLPVAAADLDGAQAILLTSRNAVRALLASEAGAAALALPVFAVGPGTEQMAREAGFANIRVGAGGARELMATVEAHAEATKGPLVHIAGEELAFDLAGALMERGYEVRRVTAYRAKAARALSQATAGKITAGALDAVLLMSPRSAAIFAQLVREAGLEPAARRLALICHSPAVADALGGLAPEQRQIAAAPNLQAMLAAVARVASQSTGV